MTNQATAAFRRTFDELGVKLPLKPSPAEISVIVDADGRDLLVVDVSADREDHQVKDLAAAVALAINASCNVLPGPALAEISAAIGEIRQAFGAPGDFGYDSKEGKALFHLYKANGALAGLISRPAAPPHQSDYSGPARDGIEAQRGLNDVFPGDPV